MSILNKPFYKDSYKVHLYYHLLNMSDSITTRGKLSIETGIDENKIERILTYFENIGEITQIKSKKNRQIIILKRPQNDLKKVDVNNSKSAKSKCLKKQNDLKKTSKRPQLLSEIKSDDEYICIAQSFQKLIRRNIEMQGGITKHIDNTKIESANSIKLLVEKDGAKIEDLRNIYQLLQTDEFWVKNILSINKIREKYNQLIIVANGKYKQNIDKFEETNKIRSIIRNKFENS